MENMAVKLFRKDEQYCLFKLHGEYIRCFKDSDNADCRICNIPHIIPNRLYESLELK